MPFIQVSPVRGILRPAGARPAGSDAYRNPANNKSKTSVRIYNNSPFIIGSIGLSMVSSDWRFGWRGSSPQGGSHIYQMFFSGYEDDIFYELLNGHITT